MKKWLVTLHVPITVQIEAPSGALAKMMAWDKASKEVEILKEWEDKGFGTGFPSSATAVVIVSAEEKRAVNDAFLAGAHSPAELTEAAEKLKRGKA